MWMGAAILRSRLFWVVLAAVSVGAYGYHMGNKHGPNARAYAAVIKELRDKNALLSSQIAEDARIAAEEANMNAAADIAFSNAAPSLKPLVADQKTADALNALIGE